MPKRKFSQHTRGQTLRPDGKFNHILTRAQTQLFRALKLARGFERQKLGRRQKDVSDKDDIDEKSARLKAEVDALKTLDINAVAEFYLRRTLARTKSVAAAPDFPEWLREWAKKPSLFQGTASANVTARLFKSTPVRSAMDEIIRKVRGALGRDGLGGVSYKLEAATGSHVPEDESTAESRKRPKGRPREGFLDGVPTRARSGTASTRSDRAISVNSDESLDRFDHYMDRVARSSDDGSLGGLVGGHAAGHLDVTKAREEDALANGNPEGRLTPMISDSKEPSSPNTGSAATTLAPSRGRPSAPPSSTTFLPSLTMGGYISGSDSVPGSSDDEAANIQIRKNRRGQRARRTIWEKKYGLQARHVKRQAEGRDDGWDAKRGATEAKAPRPHEAAKASGETQSRKPAQNGTKVKVEGLAKRKRDDEGKLHPSWEAAKKAREGKGKVAFTGKKIVFD